jgi:chemotaxis protein MotB
VVNPIPQWQTIYCSLMLLLVVFFVMLIAYSSSAKDRYLKIPHAASAVPDILSASSPDLHQAMVSLKQLGANLGIEGDFSVVKTQDGFKAVVPNPVLFGPGDASLDKGVYPILDGISEVAKRDRLSIQVEGHTDDLPIRTAHFPSNWELSTMRAVNILRYFQGRGIPPDRLVAVGFAEYRPLASNATPQGRQANRRIEIFFREVQ